MSRAIKLDIDDINEAVSKYRAALEKAKFADGKFSFSTTIGKCDDKAKVTFSRRAWDRMWALIDGFTSEVGWYGVARRSEDEDEFAYIVDDILVYPQSVTGAYVDFDEEEVAKWFFDNREDERFFNIHMHGHSHVNMAVSPSGTDKGHYKTILEQLKPDGFYIFMIWNKSRQSYCEIYDMQHNILFENGDVSMDVADLEDLTDFMADAKKQVSRKTWGGTQSAPAEKKNVLAEWAKERDKAEAQKKAETKKSQTQKRSGKSKSARSFDDYEDGYYGGFDGYYGEGSIYDGCYGID